MQNRSEAAGDYARRDLQRVIDVCIMVISFAAS
jgi:hypothetical protein